MAIGVPSLEGSLFLKDPQSIIAYILRKYFRTPKDTVPLLSDDVISLPYQVARFGKEPNTLCANMQSDLQNTYDRIFAGTRTIRVNVTQVPLTVDTADITISVMFSTEAGELSQTGTTISLVKGRLEIPEDTIRPTLSTL